MHAALDWLDATGDHVTFLRMVALLGFTWFGSDWRRGRVTAARGVELAGGVRPRLRGAVLLSYGIVEQRAALHESGPIFEEAIEIFTELDDTMRLAWATFFLGRAELVRDNENCAIHMTAAIDMFLRPADPDRGSVGRHLPGRDRRDGRRPRPRRRSVRPRPRHRDADGAQVARRLGHR